jgi:eukaryotic-like serine/threonine-protein kinase
VDVRTDVYSVAATLYYLLTGKAPFEGGDSAAVVARAASEDARSMLTLRPDLRRRLDRVVLRGLERDRRRRWSDLEVFRRALLPFVAARQTTGALFLRFFAYLIDWGLLVGVLWLIVTIVKPLWPEVSVAREGIWQFLLSVTPDLVYFGVLEGFAGLSLGKWLLGLRVYRSWENRPPGLFRALLRTALFIFLCHFPETFLDALPLDCITKIWFGLLIRFKVFGVLLILTTMRARNGFRGLHELVSGTRTVRLLRIGKTTRAAWNLGRPNPTGVWNKRVAMVDVPSLVGPFRVIGALAAQAGHRVLLGEDLVLERRVLLWLRPAGDPPQSEDRRRVGRAARTRWLSSGQGDGPWDAFTEPLGCSLPTLTAQGPLAWRETLLVLSQLADELEASLAEHTLPQTLSVEQVWVAPGGQVQLLDMPLCATTERLPYGAESAERRAVWFLNDVTDLCLRGGSLRQTRAPVPLHAADFLARLAQAPPAFASVARVRSELAQMQVRPVMVSRVQRAVHLVVQGAVLVLGILVAIVIGSYFFDIRRDRTLGVVSYVLFTSVSVILAAILRGGPSFGIVGIALVRSGGRRAAWWQAMARSLLVWAQMWTPTLGGLWLGDCINNAVPGARLQYDAMRVHEAPGGVMQSPGHLIALLCVLSYGAVVVWWPRRPWHDRVVGTHLVPE